MLHPLTLQSLIHPLSQQAGSRPAPTAFNITSCPVWDLSLAGLRMSEWVGRGPRVISIMTTLVFMQTACGWWGHAMYDVVVNRRTKPSKVSSSSSSELLRGGGCLFFCRLNSCPGSIALIIFFTVVVVLLFWSWWWWARDNNTTNRPA